MSLGVSPMTMNCSGARSFCRCLRIRSAARAGRSRRLWDSSPNAPGSVKNSLSPTNSILRWAIDSMFPVTSADSYRGCAARAANVSRTPGSSSKNFVPLPVIFFASSVKRAASTSARARISSWVNPWSLNASYTICKSVMPDTCMSLNRPEVPKISSSTGIV